MERIKEVLKNLTEAEERLKCEEREVGEVKGGLGKARNELHKLDSELREARKLLKERINEASILKDRGLKIKKELSELRGGLKEPEEALRLKVEELEWKHQITSLSRKEEERIIEEIKNLNRKIRSWVKFRKLEEELKATFTRRSELRVEIERSKLRINELKARKAEVLKKLKDLRNILKEREGKLALAKEEVGAFRRELDRLKEVELEAKALVLAEGFKKRRTVVEEARDKLKRGKRISMEELKTLVEEGAVLE